MTNKEELEKLHSTLENLKDTLENLRDCFQLFLTKEKEMIIVLSLEEVKLFSMKDFLEDISIGAN